MRTIKWLDRTQPQTLLMATIVLYINAVLSLLTGGLLALFFGVPLGVLLVLGGAVGGLGIANEKKWGYWLAVVLTALEVLQLIANFSGAEILNLVFFIALLGLLLHPQSREYRRIWFR